MRLARSIPLAALLAGCATASPSVHQAAMSAPAPSRAALRQFIDGMVDAPEFRSANWGVLVVDPGRGETLYARNADKLFMPASNMKLLTG
ncbi:MAG: D-alanyl-D-alanine carboxypeptidase, partial [bacterium]